MVGVEMQKNRTKEKKLNTITDNKNFVTNYQLSKEELREHKPKRDEFHTLEKHPIVCILDNLSNAHNVGVIIRLCEAFRIEKLFLCGSTPTLKSKKARLSSRGTQKWIDIEHVSSTDELLSTLKDKNYLLIGVELAKNSENYISKEYKNPTAFVFGNERHGINSKTLNLCDSSIYIEMFGMGNSLNVSTTAGIVLADAIGKYGILL